MKTKLFPVVAAILLLFSANAMAHDFEVDGIYYNITDTVNKTVSVVYKGSSYREHSNEYTGDVIIPENVIYNDVTYSVTSIGEDAFSNCSGLTSIKIPNSVTSIGESAFSSCSGLTAIEIPNSVTSIGGWAFWSCDGFTSITIPNSVTSIGDGAFRYCSGLTAVHISDLTAWYNIDFGSSESNPLHYAKDLYLNSELVTELVIPNSVKEIKNNAFYNCTGLTSVTIPNSVTSIGTFAFAYCSGLTSVTIGNNVTSIGERAFEGCSGLTGIEIPNSVTSIGGWAFNGCSGLTAVHISDLTTWCNIDFGSTASNPLDYAKNLYLNNELVAELLIPNDITTIKDYALSGCSGLTSIEIPNSVTSIGKRAFNGCSGLTSVEIPNSVTSIGEGAFCGCSGLTSIEIPNSVTSIGRIAFAECSGLTSIEIPNSVTSIGDYAFSGCSGLTSITIPNSVTSIDDEAFYGCSGLERIELNCDTIYNWFKGNTSIKEIVIGNGVKSFEYDAFKDCSGIERVELNCETIDDCFKGNASIKEIVIGNEVTSIGGSAFSRCSSLISIEIPNSVTSIGSFAFEDCGWWNNQPDGLIYKDGWLLGYKGDKPTGNLIIAEGTKGIAGSAFYYCSGLTDIEIPNSVTSIVERAFDGCYRLTGITIPNSVTSIGEAVFSDCDALTSIIIAPGNTVYDSRDNCNAIIETVTNALVAGCNNTIIPGSVTSIAQSAFQKCSGFTSIEIPNSVTSIGEHAFWDCTGLTSITIPNSVTSIGVAVFRDCTGLTNITIPNSVTSIGEDAFSGCSGLTSIAIPNSVTSIGRWAFWDCTGLTSITIPNSVTSIEEDAFRVCSGLTSVTIGNSVTNIGNSAFYNCTGLKTVINYSSLNLTAGATDNGSVARYADEVINIPNTGNEGDFVFNETDDDCFLVGYLGNDTELILPLTYNNWNYSVGGLAFKNKTSITRVIIPNCVTSIEESAFEGCTGLKTVINYSSLNLTAGATDNGYVAHYADEVINIPNTGNEGDFVFNETDDGRFLVGYLGAETEVVLPENYKGLSYMIAENAFKWSLKEMTCVTIPKSVTGLRSKAFDGCSKLRKIYMINKIPPRAGLSTFTDAQFETLTLYVPTDAIEAYQNADVWRHFWYIEAISPACITLDKTVATLFVGEQLTLVATISPDNLTAEVITWTTSDTNIATVEDGVVTALSKGVVTITATAGDFSVSCETTIVTETGIDEVNHEIKDERAKSKEIFDLQGRKVKTENGELKGIYIIDGKKVFIK